MSASCCSRRGAKVRAFVRRLDERAECLRSLGAEVVAGDFLDYPSVERALAGVSTVYFAGGRRAPAFVGKLDSIGPTAAQISGFGKRRNGITQLSVPASS